jgi:myo-inositol-1(or 4)-monophosphatase
MLSRRFSSGYDTIEDEYMQQTSLYKTCLETAKVAGEYLVDRFKRNAITVTSSYDHDVKLDVDVATENLMKENIRKKFPDHGFICEESGRVDEADDGNWVIDPLDGSVNYFMGIPHFCTSIAFKQNNTYVVGAVYDPVRDELFSADSTGAFLNGSPIQRHSVTRLAEVVISGGFFKAQSLEDGSRIFQKISKRVRKIRFFGSAALDLCYLACGRVNAYIQHWVNEWDIAAAALIVEKSGAVLDITNVDEHLNVIAGDRTIFSELQECITSS